MQHGQLGPSPFSVRAATVHQQAARPPSRATRLDASRAAPEPEVPSFAYPSLGLSSHAQGSSGVVDNILFA